MFLLLNQKQIFSVSKTESKQLLDILDILNILNKNLKVKIIVYDQRVSNIKKSK